MRVHHRLTQIHGFPNGNGRHARIMADLLIEKLGGEPFTWGSGSIHDTGMLRITYINALKAADDTQTRAIAGIRARVRSFPE